MQGESDESAPPEPFRHSRRPELAIAAIAGRQGGVISFAQLVALGLSRAEIRHRVEVGWLRRIHRGVFAVGYEPLTREGRWWAAILAAGDGAVLSHRSAAALWGLLPESEDEVHVTVAGVQRRRYPGVRPHRNRLDKEEMTERRGIPVTSPERTIIDLAASHPNLLEQALRQAEYEHLTNAASLVAAVGNLEGRRGVRALRRALRRVTEAPGVTRSTLERPFLTFLRRHKVAMPKLNVPLHVDDRWFELDCLWPAHRVIVELDGRAAHATSSAFESDRARDAALQAAGYAVVRVTWRRLNEDATRLAAELRAVLAHRE